LKSLVGDGNRIAAKIVAYLAEVEERRIHLELACSSMFVFCTKKLGFSEGEAFRRITAARLARRFPAILDAIASGRVHLSTLVLMRDHFTNDNVRGLLEEAAGKSKREIEELVARLAPRPDVASSIRKLPERAVPPMPQLGALPITASAQISCGPGAPEPCTLPMETAPSAAVGCGLGMPASGAGALACPALVHVGFRAAERGARPRANAVPQVQPLSEARYRVQLTASAALREKLEHARRLVSHRNPEGDLAVIVEEALDLLIEKLERVKLGKTERPRAATKAPQDSGHVTQATRRAVVERDGLQCAFVATNGERCGSREAARVRPSDTAHARRHWRCREHPNALPAHNRFAAEQAFGRRHIEERIDIRQRKCGTGAETKERVRGALRAMGFRSAEAERAVTGIDAAAWDGRPVERLMREAIGLIT
jgi:hypothetical protein